MQKVKEVEFFPIGDRVVVRMRQDNRTEDGYIDTGRSGLVLTEFSKERPLIGEVVAIGPKASQLKVGDTVFYAKFAGVDIPKLYGEDVFVVLREEDEILTKIVETEREPTAEEVHAAELESAPTEDFLGSMRKLAAIDDGVSE